ncbi:MAG: hypothetical protein ACRBCL_00625 [Maritimibacter sp.]
MNNLPQTARLWEPLHVGNVRYFRRAGFSFRQYIEENSTDEATRHRFEALFMGKILSPYMVSQTTPRDLWAAQRLQVKFCRATQILPYLTNAFSFECAPVHIIRHPCAVVSSQMKWGAWDKVNPKISEAEILASPLLLPYRDTLLKIQTIEERLAAFWAIVNKVALTHADRKLRWQTVHYENLLLDPMEGVCAILKRWNIAPPTHLEELVRRPSQTTLTSSPITGGNVEHQLSLWKNRLSEHSVSAILDIVHEIGVDIYDASPTPRASAT